MDGYDFVVVGAGTAGCVMAARLSEDAGANVLLLEAGSGKLPEAVAEPPAWPTLAATSANWGNASVVMAATGTSIPLPRGRGLGGSSAINGMVFTRGHRSSYDAWVAGGACAIAPSGVGGRFGGSGRARIPDGGRRQQRSGRRLRLVGSEHRRWSASERRRCVPRACATAPQPHGAHR